MGWTFTQLGGDRKTLTLDGYSAPFGRPRKDPVIKEIIKISVQTTLYPGSKNSPTRHMFGSSWEPVELKGRWMTRHMNGTNSAGSMANDWTTFVREELPVRFSWGNIATYRGIIDELELSREGEHDIAWRMHILVDVRDDSEIIWRLPTERSPQFNSTLVDDFRTNAKKLLAAPTEDMNLSIAESLDFLFGNLKRVTAILLDVADTFDNIEKSTESTINSFRGIIANVYSAIAEMRLTIINATTPSVIKVERTDSNVAWDLFRADFDVTSLRTIAILNEMDRTLEIQARSTTTKFVEAKEGDTWERLATRAGSGPDNAGVLREANGIRFGYLPQPGQTYLVP